MGEVLKSPRIARANLRPLKDGYKVRRSFHRNLRGIASAESRNLISSSVCMILIEVIEKRGERWAREGECCRLRADDWWDISVMRVLS